jgi:hypothetical protein
VSSENRPASNPVAAYQALLYYTSSEFHKVYDKKKLAKPALFGWRFADNSNSAMGGL